MLGMLSRDGGARGRKLRTEVWSRCGDQKNGFLARDRSVSLPSIAPIMVHSGLQKNLETYPGISPFMVIMSALQFKDPGWPPKFLPLHRVWCNNSGPRIGSGQFLRSGGFGHVD